MTIELVSYADLKSLLDLEETAITSYPSLSVIRDGVVSAIETYIGRDLESGDYETTLFLTSKTAQLKLNALPIESVDSVVVTQYGEDTTLDSDNYMILGYGLHLHYPVGQCKVVVNYTGGYDAADVPAPIKRAALIQTAYEFQSKDQIGASSVTTEGGSVQRPALGLLKEVKRMLDRYKHPLSWI
jgi:hypothetical protein